jgi:hypothetical protein
MILLDPLWIGTVIIGEWRSLVSAPALGAGGRRFESALPDFVLWCWIEKDGTFRYI